MEYVKITNLLLEIAARRFGAGEGMDGVFVGVCNRLKLDMRKHIMVQLRYGGLTFQSSSWVVF